MTGHRIDAIRGTDPRGFLAAVGLLIAAGEGATLRFDEGRPVLETVRTADQLADELLDRSRFDEGHPLEGDWCRATAGAEGWVRVGAPRSWEPLARLGAGWGSVTRFGPAWTRMVRSAVWKEPESKHALTGLWLNTASGKIGVDTQVKALVPADGSAGKLSRAKLVGDVAALLDGRHPVPDGPTVLGLGASRARATHTVELLTLVGGLVQPPGACTPLRERGLTWAPWDVPLTLEQAYPVMRDPARYTRRRNWPLLTARIESPDTGSYAKVYGPTRTVQAAERPRPDREVHA